MTLAPMQVNNSCAALNSSSSPPTMKVRLAMLAAPTPNQRHHTLSSVELNNFKIMPTVGMMIQDNQAKHTSSRLFPTEFIYQSIFLTSTWTGQNGYIMDEVQNVTFLKIVFHFKFSDSKLVFKTLAEVFQP